MAFPASLFAAQVQIHGADAFDGDLAVAGDGEDVGFEGGVGSECGAVDGDVGVRGGTEDPVVAGVAVVEGRFVRVGRFGDAESSAATLMSGWVVGLEEAGDVGAWLDAGGWEVTSWVVKGE